MRQCALLLFALFPLAARAAESREQVTARLLSSYGSVAIRPAIAAAELAKLTMGTDECMPTQPPPDAIEAQVYVDQFMPLDMDKQTWALDGYLRAWWHDARLEYNGTTSATSDGGFSCTDELSFKAAERSQIWKPDFYWEGAKTVTLPNPSKGTGELLKVKPSGEVFWSRQVSLVLSCHFSQGTNLDKLPFDTQDCTYMMGMFAETDKEVTLSWKDGLPALANWQGACMAEWHATGFARNDAVYEYSSGNYTYAEATVSFTRSPEKWMSSYFMPSVIMVMLSYLGFYLDPAVTPARVALGMLCLVVVMTNFVGLARILPPTASPPWLVRVMLYSFMFNVIAMVEQVTVSFGLNANKWLTKEREGIRKSMPWKKALVLSKDKVVSLFHVWDENNDGKLSKHEFRLGIKRLGFDVSASECNALFNRFDVDVDNRLDLNELSTMLDSLETELLTEEQKQKLRNTVDPNKRATMGRLRAPSTWREDISHSALGNAASPSSTPQSLPASPPPSPPAAAEEGEATKQQTEAASAAEVTVDVKQIPVAAKNSVLLNSASKDVKELFRAQAEEDGHNLIWRFKYFVIFPLLVKLSHMDHVFRVIFIPVYALYLLIALSEVNFGEDTARLLATAPCYASARGLDGHAL